MGARERSCIFLGLLVLLAALVSGCNTYEHSLVFVPDYRLEDHKTVKVGEVVDMSGKDHEVDVGTRFTDALIAEIEDSDHLDLGDDPGALVIEVKIIDYEPGNAFKRWLLPGWGNTVFVVNCDLKEADRSVGTANVIRDINFGGLFTIGAWTWVITESAEDVVEDLEDNISD